jgi:hypothetical protein
VASSLSSKAILSIFYMKALVAPATSTMTSYAPCPKCSNSAAEKVKFTWWGGLLGPKILTHVKCGACGTAYNGKTGKDNATGIAIYCVIVGIVCLGLIVVIFAALGIFLMAAK